MSLRTRIDDALGLIGGDVLGLRRSAYGQMPVIPVGWHINAHHIIATGSVAPLAGTAAFMPFKIGPGQTFDRFALVAAGAISGGAGYEIQCALYPTGPDGLPVLGSPVAQASFTDFSTTGAKSALMTAPVMLPAGAYWIGTTVRYTTAPTTNPNLLCVSQTTFLGVPAPSTGLATSRALTITGTTSSPLPTSGTFAASQNTNFPSVWLRRSA